MAKSAVGAGANRKKSNNPSKRVTAQGSGKNSRHKNKSNSKKLYRGQGR